MTLTELVTKHLQVKTLTVKLDTLRAFAITSLKRLLRKFGRTGFVLLHPRQNVIVAALGVASLGEGLTSGVFFFAGGVFNGKALLGTLFKVPDGLVVLGVLGLEVLVLALFDVHGGVIPQLRHKVLIRTRTLQ